jgi:tetratricopeptide (TPR) repeat protein
MGHIDSGIAAARRAVQLNPLDQEGYGWLAGALEGAGRYDEAIEALNEAIALAPPGDALLHVQLGNDYYELGNLERSRSECEIGRGNFTAEVCLAATYEKLGRHRDAQAELAKLRASAGDAGAYLYAEIYAQWGRTAEALEWLDTAMRLRSPCLLGLKGERSLDPLRNQPRFQAIERGLKFPNTVLKSRGAATARQVTTAAEATVPLDVRYARSE